MRLLDYVFPKRCLECGRVGRYFCAACQRKIRVIAPNESICPVCERAAIDGATHPGCYTRYAIDGLTSFFRYDGIIRKAVKALKYRFVSDLASEFVSLVPTETLDSLINRWIPDQARDDSAVVVPIPLHSSRQRERGYNQAEVLGSMVARRIGKPLRADILKRTRKTTPQVEMKKREARIKNMEHVFAMNNKLVKLQGNILLFDDVFTTGATMRSASNVLKRNGAKIVWGITMAR